jgi:hypothetical protein
MIRHCQDRSDEAGVARIALGRCGNDPSIRCPAGQPPVESCCFNAYIPKMESATGSVVRYRRNLVLGATFFFTVAPDRVGAPVAGDDRGEPDRRAAPLGRPMTPR